MLPILAIAILVALLAFGVLAACGPRLLLSWHMREIRRMKVAEQPGEAIVTYPLA